MSIDTGLGYPSGGQPPQTQAPQNARNTAPPQMSAERLLAQLDSKETRADDFENTRCQNPFSAASRQLKSANKPPSQTDPAQPAAAPPPKKPNVCQKIGHAFSSLAHTATKALHTVGHLAGKALHAVSHVVSSVWHFANKELHKVGHLAGKALHTVGHAASSAWHTATHAVSSVGKKASHAVSGAWHSATHAVSSTWHTATHDVSDVAKKGKKAAEDLAS